MKRFTVIYVSTWGRVVSEVFAAKTYEKVHDIFNDIFGSCFLLDIQDKNDPLS